MACELLAGPNIFTNGNDAGSPPAVLTDFSFWTTVFYDDGLGLCGYTATLGGYSIAQLDGTTHLRSNGVSRANDFVLDLQRPGEYLMRSSLFEDAIYEFNKLSGTTGALLLSGGTSFVGDVMVRCPDRYLYVFANAVKYKPLDLSGAWIAEATLTGGGALATVSRTKSADIIAIGWDNGAACFYNVVTKQQVGAVVHVAGTNVGLHYSPKHDIFILLTTHGIGIRADALDIYANAVRPYSLSNPVALSSVVQGRVSQVRARLLGSNSDPCAGELVDWSITAGAGALAQAQSTTDADGYAYNDYIAPVSGGAGSPFGSVTIQAQALF